MGLFWRCKACRSINGERIKYCQKCGSADKESWFVRVWVSGVHYQKFFKDYDVAKQVYLELKRKQEMLNLAKKFQDVDEKFVKLIGADEEEKGKWVKVKVFWAKYLKWLMNHKKESTVKERISKWKTNLKKFFGEKTLAEVTPTLIDKFQSAMKKKGYSNAAINRYVAIIRHMITMAVKWGYLKEHTLKGKIEMLRENQERWVFLSQEDFERLFDNTSETYKDLCLFLVLTGARLGEALNLKWKNIIWNAGIAYLRDSKTNRERVIVLSERVLDLLEKRYRRSNPGESDRIFKHSASEFRRAFKKALEKAGLSKSIRIHDLRHTFASWLALSGVPVQQIKELLGHSQISTTMRYSHLNPEALKEALDVLDRKTEGKIIHIDEYKRRKRKPRSQSGVKN